MTPDDSTFDRGTGANVPLRAVQDAVGHADPRATRRYNRGAPTVNTDDLTFDQRMEQRRREHVDSLIFREGERVAAARRLVGSHWDEYGDHEVEFDVPQGTEGRITSVRQFVHPSPYVVRFDDGTDLSVAEDNLARVS